MSRLAPLAGGLALLAGCSSGVTPAPSPAQPAQPPTLRHPAEAHLADLVQLTHGGENAEAYWSFDGTQLIFQTTRSPYGCDQIMHMPATAPGDGLAKPSLLSTGTGRTTCAYFLPGDQDFVYASTHEVSAECPTPPDMSKGYVWALFDYDIYRARVDGTGLTKLTSRPGYDAEATVCAVDGSILFTSTRNGDLDLYRMNADGSDVVQLTDLPGYDGGAFFNRDCTKILWRASRPTGADLEDYRRLLAENLVRPSKLEIFVANADGSEARQVTYLDAASFAPYWHPSGERILFSTNYGDPRGREFDIWAIDADGTDLERITYTPGFDGFPMFSPDGTRLAFASNRNQAKEGDTDVYVARWVGGTPVVEDESAADRVMRGVAWLADDAREGRGVGTKGLADAAKWIEEQLRAAGVEPGAGQGFAQPFEVTTGLDGGAVVTLGGKAVDGASPLGFSASGKVRGQTVFAGYGIVAPEVGLDDYKGKSVKGKVVVVRRFLPEGQAFEDRDAERRYGDLHHKAFIARERGAAALVVVDVPVVAKGADVPGEAPAPALAARLGEVGIPVVILPRAVGTRLVKGRHTMEIDVALTPTKQQAVNIVGRIRAPEAKRLPGVVVIGAHYDHLGLGGQGSLEPDAKAPHNGADDNASGTAALLEVARWLVAHRTELRRDVIVVAFSGEESGLIGSTFFTKNLPDGVAPAEVVAMLNMDMVGRLRKNALSVLGGDSAAEWMELVEPACYRARVRCAIDGSGYGPSDQTPFYAAGVPVLHFFTGAHGDYHKTTDDTPAINAGGIARVAAIVADVAMQVAARDSRLTLQEVPAPLPAGDARSFGASLGTIPDYAATDEPGVTLAGVRPGGPADAGGLRRGDRIIKIGATDIRSINDLMFVLRAAKPDQRVVVVVVRDGKHVSLPVTFGGAARAPRSGGH